MQINNNIAKIYEYLSFFKEYTSDFNVSFDKIKKSVGTISHNLTLELKKITDASDLSEQTKIAINMLNQSASYITVISKEIK